MISLSTYELKPRFQEALRPLLRLLRGKGLTPNMLTVGALVFCLSFGVSVIFFREKALVFYPAVLLARMALNALDGLMARVYDLRSNVGALLNELTDVLSDGFLYVPFLVFPEVSPMAFSTLLVLAHSCEVLGLAALLVGRQRSYRGPFGKSDRALLFGVLALLLSFNLLSEPSTLAFLCFGIALSMVTIWNRFKDALEGQAP